jgi:hypothetical protein
VFKAVYTSKNPLSEDRIGFSDRRCIGPGQSFNGGKSMGKTWPDIKIVRNKNVYVFVS